jgi:hypothetical protein
MAITGNLMQSYCQGGRRDSNYNKTLDIASISPVESSGDVCVGDKLEYSLSSVEPFTVCKFIFSS